MEQDSIPAFESGTVVLATGHLDVMRVDLTSTQIKVDIEDKAFIKRLIAMRSQFTPAPKKADQDQTPNVGGVLSMIRSVAETLRSRGITIIVSYQGHRIATIGADAKPTILQHITKTRGVALNSLYTAIKMMI